MHNDLDGVFRVRFVYLSRATVCIVLPHGFLHYRCEDYFIDLDTALSIITVLLLLLRISL